MFVVYMSILYILMCSVLLWSIASYILMLRDITKNRDITMIKKCDSAVEQELKCSRSLYITHKKNSLDCAGYFGKRCEKYRKLLEKELVA